MLSPAFIGGVGWQEILVLMLLVCLIFGARRLPELARNLGRGVLELRRGLSGEPLADNTTPRDRLPHS